MNNDDMMIHDAYRLREGIRGESQFQQNMLKRT